ncbi:hypothetical protein [Lactobacillus sp. PV037]|uniref:hypothetical protein n=1 Tax=Lactobacillus sp. PV037 TaxID=2594496 RepID=UPI00223F23CC|nr:hypothetical protein [Lactobacillus sp. PV037]
MKVQKFLGDYDCIAKTKIKVKVLKGKGILADNNILVSTYDRVFKLLWLGDNV